MGKPFDDELHALPDTYSWAFSQPIEKLSRAVERLLPSALLAVGSGGSFSVCHFACHLHGIVAHQPAIPLTPLQAVAGRTPSSQMGVIIPTAGGNNPDVIAATRILAELEPRSMLIICGNADSRVARLAASYEMIDFVPFELPFGRDGFLATNSLLAFCVLLGRAYSEVIGQQSNLPKDFRSLLNYTRMVKNPASADRIYQELLQKETLLVLHGPSTTSAAVDIESKFTESALGHVQLADFRQFAHGRHHWLAKNPDSTAVLSLESSDDEDVASQTISLLPKSVPCRRLIVSRCGWQADLAAIIEGFYLVRAAGQRQGIDPGRPGVPAFGRKLYHANAFRKRRAIDQMPPWKARAIERKASESIERLASEDRLSFWQAALDAFLEQLLGERFSGLVVDYDGTLCHEDKRFDPLPDDISQLLSTHLAAGMLLGVATGRGKSVRERLREALPQKFWSQVIVGYYNGGRLLSLDDPTLPDGSERVGSDLVAFADAVKDDGLLTQGEITLRDRQITLRPARGLTLQALCEHAESVATHVCPGTVRIARSGHSVDIVPRQVTKLAVVESLQQMAGKGGAASILRIGDRGRWPGNDAQLLGSPHGLSAFEVSSDASSCWNLSLPGHRGHQATLRYLTQLKVNKRGIRLQWRSGTGGLP